MELSITLQNKVVDFLISLPNMHDSYSQQAFIYQVGLDSQLQSQIQFEKPTSEFVPLLIVKLLKYGKLNDGRYALEAVLESAKHYIGQDKRTYCESLLKELRIELEKCEHQFLSQQETTKNEKEEPQEDRTHIQLRKDWGEAPDVSVFYGRQNELATLEQWIVKDHCRVIAILGMAGIGKTQLSIKLGKGGIGKTDLTLKLAKGIQDEFDYIIWRRVLNAPPLSEVLTEMIKFLSNQQEIDLPEKVSDQISRLLHYLKTHRCLVILDNIEAILKGGNRPGECREGYEGYGKLLRKVGEVTHQSCLLLTSREKPQDIARLEGEKKPVRSLELNGLDDTAGKRLFETMGSFSGTEDEWQQLIEFYDGNPLALELAAKHISEVFFGDISEFLEEGKPIFYDLSDLLDWHFNRLSNLEKEIMFWLAVEREPISFSGLKEDILSVLSREKLSSTLQALQRCIPLEKSAKRFTLQPVLIEYMTKRLIEQIGQEIKFRKSELID